MMSSWLGALALLGAGSLHGSHTSAMLETDSLLKMDSIHLARKHWLKGRTYSTGHATLHTTVYRQRHPSRAVFNWQENSSKQGQSLSCSLGTGRLTVGQPWAVHQTCYPSCHWPGQTQTWHPQTPQALCPGRLRSPSWFCCCFCCLIGCQAWHC